ncbi:molybdenum cofactor guanylyltransferase MobA [Acidovorax sp. SUPP3334]|uniref:molybdenum cofactor guanylyltransferase MobA n=1 Tax=Acidovorax sp. SUPP3334 TaxID=2920881 RepID=UPI0023DE5DC9|nr:molybdenum cofactor guanylyltransferase MobA [Acidovorax sp. SUPP3334]GKT24574.1 molybdenum cofactor guanylyltransferase MobA [Acidovorax sp. SUPP3334]
MGVRTADGAAGITGLVLAGGQGTRMGGQDKGLQAFQGVPLALHALRRLRPQVGGVLISANRHLDQYAAFGAPVLPDALPGHAGPLAGFLAGLSRCDTPWLLTVPCDTPLFPHDVAERLLAAALAGQADLAIAAAPATDAPHASAPSHPPRSATPGEPALRTQPVFCLMRAALRASLEQFLDGGSRKIGAWTAQHRCAVAPFDRPGDDPLGFCNANTLAELHALERVLTPPPR